MKYTVASLTVVALLSGNAMAQRKPNIILFLVDDMGWQDTSLPFWKDTTDLNRIYETPNMERLAERELCLLTLMPVQSVLRHV